MSDFAICIMNIYNNNNTCNNKYNLKYLYINIFYLFFYEI